MGEEDADGNYETYLEHVKATGLQQILPVRVRMGPNYHIPFPDERMDTRRDYADCTPMQSGGEFALLRTAGLI
jgi:hypothetical protein